jgi:N-acetyl-beta-hexosaminidase
MYANNWNIVQNMTDNFPFPYSENSGRALIEFATKHNPIYILTIDINGQAVAGIVIHPQDDIHKRC